MSPSLEARLADLLDLPDEEAALRHLDARNFRWLTFYAYGVSVCAVLAGLWYLAQAEYLRLGISVANLVIARAVFVLAEREHFRANFRHYLIGFLVIQILSLAGYHPLPSQGLNWLAFVAPLLLLPFRFRPARTISLFTALWVLCSMQDLRLLLEEITATGTLSDNSVAIRLGLTALVTVICATISVTTTTADRSAFLANFRVESSRHRDRNRMREELDYARQIQLKMLPRHDPVTPGLDISALCLPATEVGGDYYEYFPGSQSDLTVVIGDVAGHGVASGLLLSGLRSGLHLLKGEGHSPGEVLTRLDRMVRDTNDSRMIISLLLLSIDADRRRASVASAGHPPMLHFSNKTSHITEIGQDAPPLGTRLPVDFRESEVSLEVGDLLVLTTDGVHETLNPSDDYYGYRRLIDRLRQLANRKSREIREAILADVWNFKGNKEQEDDVTLIVIKITA